MGWIGTPARRRGRRCPIRMHKPGTPVRSCARLSPGRCCAMLASATRRGPWTMLRDVNPSGRRYYIHMGSRRRRRYYCCSSSGARGCHSLYRLARTTGKIEESEEKETCSNWRRTLLNPAGLKLLSRTTLSFGGAIHTRQTDRRTSLRHPTAIPTTRRGNDTHDTNSLLELQLAPPRAFVRLFDAARGSSVAGLGFDLRAPAGEVEQRSLTRRTVCRRAHWLIGCGTPCRPPLTDSLVCQQRRHHHARQCRLLS